MFKRNRLNEACLVGPLSMLHGNKRIEWESKNPKSYGDHVYRSLFWIESPEKNPSPFQRTLPKTPEGEIEWILACMELDRRELIKYANIEPEKEKKIIELLDSGIYPEVSELEAAMKKTDTMTGQTIVLKHSNREIKDLISITKQDKTIGITFTTDFLIVMAVNDYVSGCIPIILYARNFSVDTVYTRFLSVIGKMAIKKYNSRYFGGRIPESHLMNGQLRSDYRYEAVQLAIKMDKIIKKDILC